MIDTKSIIPWNQGGDVTVKRGEGADAFTSLRREMDRVFDDFFTGFAGRSMLPTLTGMRDAMPVVDVSETEKDVIVTAEMPGLDKNDFEVTLARDVLTIRGEKKAEHERKDGDSYYAERRYGGFARSIRLPFEVADEQVDANYDKGVLTVRVPKPADLQKSIRRIEVKAA